MSPPIVGGEKESQSTLVGPLTPVDDHCLSQNGFELKERNYLGLSPESSSVDSSGGDNLNLKATELRLGLPGSHSPDRQVDEKKFFPLAPSKDGFCSGTKRVFSEMPSKGLQKAQVVGWPPIRSFRKNSMVASAPKSNEEVDGKPGVGALFVKVSMDGAPYLRKVDLRSYSAYQDLSSALEKMFTSFTIGQCGSHGGQGKEKLSESKLRDLLHGSEYVLTYEDKDGDWMLVGDVPWEMFIDSCKKLKIMKGSDAIGLAPRAMMKSQNKS